MNLAREKLRLYRNQHGLSLRDLGARLEVSGANIDSLLRTQQIPRLSLALRMERICNIPASEWSIEVAATEVGS